MAKDASTGKKIAIGAAVTIMISVTPAATASSTISWMTGLSMIGSISLGIALVCGKNRVPRPAAAMTAFLTGGYCIYLDCIKDRAVS